MDPTYPYPFDNTSGTCMYGGVKYKCRRPTTLHITRHKVEGGKLVDITAYSCSKCYEDMCASVNRWSPAVPEDLKNKTLSWKTDKSSFTCTIASPHMLRERDGKCYVIVRDTKTASLKKLLVNELMEHNRGLPQEVKFLESSWCVRR